MEKKSELELLKQEIPELKKENKLLTIKSKIKDFINENYSDSLKMGVWVEVTFKETNNYGIVLNIESNNDFVKFESNEIEIGYSEIRYWFEKNQIEFNQTNLIKCLNNLIESYF